jgi:predicted esterase
MERSLLAGSVLWVVVAWVAPVGASGAGPMALPKAAGAVEFAPGKEAKVEDAALKYYMVYTPSDYTGDRAWPLIVWMHGMGGKPNLGPIKRLTEGKGYVIVGHEYVFAVSKKEDHATEVANLKRVVSDVSKRLRIDPHCMLLGGFSQGGWWTSMLSEYTMDSWAGLIITGSGEHATRMGAKAKVTGKPVYIGAGEKDSKFLPFARDAAAKYKARGAAVTFEEWPGLGHSDNVNSETLKNWLLTQGPFRAAKADLAAGKAAESAGKLGAAYAVYERLEKIAAFKDSPAAGDMRKSMDAIEAKANKMLADAESALGKGQKPQASRLLTQASQVFAGCCFGVTAKERLAKLQP